MKGKLMFKQTACIMLIVLTTSCFTIGASSQRVGISSPGSQNPALGKALLQPDIIYEKSDGNLLVSAKPVFEALGAEVNYDEENKFLFLRKGTLTIRLQIDNAAAYVNGKQIQLNVPPRLKGGEIMLDRDFICSVMEASIELDASKGKINMALLSREKELPNLVKLQADLQKQTLSREYDTAHIYNNKLTAIELDRRIIQNTAAPKKIDFSDYVTFTGNQDGWGGCIGRSIIHCINIIKEKEHPYTPDLSFRYLQYHFEKARDEYLEMYPNSTPDQWPPFTEYVLMLQGICSEGDLPSDYDPAIRNVSFDAGGIASYSYDLSPLPEPTAENEAEASLYKVRMFNIQNPGVDDTKKLMQQFGPIVGCGFTENMDHAVSIIGYDDDFQNTDGSMGAFKILNSWGDMWSPYGTWNGDGTCRISYKDFNSRFDTLQYFINYSSDRSSHRDAYTARIRIDHRKWRNMLTVKVGVFGKEPMIVWDRYNNVWNNCFDFSKSLYIDVPLPSYAAEHWPPNNIQNSWYIEVTNNCWYDSSESEEYNRQRSAVIKEITLARLIKNPDGTMQTQTFTSPITDHVLGPEETEYFYVTGNAIDSYGLTLGPKNILAEPGNPIVLSGKLTKGIRYSDTVMAPGAAPVPNKTVAIYKVNTSDEGSYWDMISGAVTDSDGRFACTVTPSGSSIYVAGYMDEDREMAATSNMARVIMLSSELPHINHNYYTPQDIIINGSGFSLDMGADSSKSIPKPRLNRPAE